MNSIAQTGVACSPAHAAVLSDPKRLGELRQTGLLDAIPEEAFDRAVRLATTMLGVPVGLVSLVDVDRQVFKAQAGLPDDVAQAAQTPLSHSFCQYVVSTDRQLVVNDAREHPELRHNGAVEDLNVIAYLGMPIHGPTGRPIGSFCAIDSVARHWTEQDRLVVADLAAIVESEIRLRDEAARRKLVMSELAHRVGNLFSVISGMVAITARHESDTRSMSTTLRGRIAALARAHNLIRPSITDPSNGGAPASLLVTAQSLLAPYLYGDEERC